MRTNTRRPSFVRFHRLIGFCTVKRPICPFFNSTPSQYTFFTWPGGVVGFLGFSFGFDGDGFCGGADGGAPFPGGAVPPGGTLPPGDAPSDGPPLPGEVPLPGVAPPSWDGVSLPGQPLPGESPLLGGVVNFPSRNCFVAKFSTSWLLIIHYFTKKHRII